MEDFENSSDYEVTIIGSEEGQVQSGEKAAAVTLNGISDISVSGSTLKWT